MKIRAMNMEVSGSYLRSEGREQAMFFKQIVGIEIKSGEACKNVLWSVLLKIPSTKGEFQA